MKVKQHKTDGQKTINGAPITLFRAGVIAILGLVLCAGAVAGAFPADWTNSDLITIHEHSGSDLVDYQIPVELNASNFDFTKAQPGGADGTAPVIVLTNGSITGKVTDSATGPSIEGATATVDGETTQTIVVSPSTAMLNIGDTEQFTATAYDASGIEISGVSFTWSSTNTYVGTIDANGLFTANKGGSTTVKATNETIVGTAAVTVLANGSITGKVTDSVTGLNIKDATVIAGGITTQTNTAGSYAISLKAGTYTVSASKARYMSQTETNVAVTTGNPTIVNFALVRDYVELELNDTSPKRGYVNQDVIFNLTVKNYGQPSIFTITNPSITNVTISKTPSSTSEIPAGGSQDISVTINATYVGAYPVTITASNATKSASTTIVANVIDPAASVVIGDSNITGSTLENGTVVIDSNVTESTVGNGTVLDNSDVSYATASGDTIITDSEVTNTTVTDSVIENSTVTNTTVTDSFIIDSTVIGGVIAGSTLTNTTTTDTVVESSTVTGSTATNSIIKSSTVTNTNTTDTAVEGSTLVNVNATGCTIEDVTLENIKLESATVTSQSGKATIQGGTGAKVSISGEGGVEVYFENVYEDIPVEDLIKSQTVPQTVQSNVTVNTTAAEAAKVGASLSLNSTTGGSVTISKCGINPGGSTFALQGFSGSVVGDYLHIDSDIPGGTIMTVTFCIYYGTTEPGSDKWIVWYNWDTLAWESMPTTKEHKADGWYLCTKTDHLSIYAVATTASDPITATIALEIAVGSRPFDDAADVSGDGRVTSLDALMILQAASDAIEL
ncbi:MAG: Carboxypeptidase regulatory-like domain protein [Candidatus Argoarchaeum ethanivorans]|uniref:Carboxypeptidase regulatory-like domain protein n=1 Tax=Candidatus Argoarchaeum ethanivorans TaxID=2608793 RepID=A0A811T4K9_9EURY|nr:MAG: Carboxypeptidase regulatory-like domain protein [Candidatus Argoarchaeum ethanivorans]